MAEGASAIAIGDEVFGIAELGAQILGFLPVADLRRAALVSRRWQWAARFHLWQAIRVPFLHSSRGPRIANASVAFWDRYSGDLERHTLSLDLRMTVVDPANYGRIMGRSWELPAQTPECFAVKVDLDTLFHGIHETLARAKRLRAFAATDVPRILDLLRLLQLHHPDLQSISIEASIRDCFGLRPLPAIDIPHWNYQLRANPNLVVPLANSVNLSGLGGLGIVDYPVLAFPNLRLLSLTNLQYDCQHPSPLLEPVVTILLSAPNLAHLELSLRCTIGGITLSGNFLPLMYGGINARRNPLRALCLRYRQAGGQPLQLETLRLGFGFEIGDIDFFRPRPHYLSALTDLACLAELHLESPFRKTGTRLHPFSGCLGFGLATSSPLLGSPALPALPGFGMPNIRKLTWPWHRGMLIRLLCCHRPGRLDHIILRIDQPTVDDWENDPYPTWVERRHVSGGGLNVLKLKGLVLPTDQMTPEDADRFLGFVQYLKPMHVLKVRMPSLTRGAKSRGSMRTFKNRMERMTELRELWLADGLGCWTLTQVNGQQVGQYVQDPYPTDAQFNRFATTIADKCPKLVYLRILDRAWTITRSGEEGAAPVVKPLAPWQVGNEVPDAFDWRKPKVF